jgi:glycerol-3-phosphate acyltransferase PlsY
MAGRVADVTGCAAGYLIGSIPVGLLLGKATRGLDVRDYGSGNIGTTNVLRIVGPSAAALTFALDAGKGAAAVQVARALGADRGGQAAAGLAALVGHSWPVFAHFRGGKGVATGFGALLLISPGAAAFAVAGGLTALGLSRIVSVGSLSSVACATVAAAVEKVRSGDSATLGFAALASTLIVLRHGDNVRRLFRGEEPRVSLHRSSDVAA